MERAYSSTTERPTRKIPSWAVLAVVCLGQFMVVLDVSIVNVALPAMQDDLGFTRPGLQWVVNAYTLAFAGFLLLGGRLADLYGRKRIFMVGVSLFAAASLVGGFADSPGLLIAARAVQGLGGAVLSPATLTVLTTTFPEGPQRARAIGLWSAVGAVGGAVGGLVGGGLTQLLSWRWILFVNVPVGLVALAVAALVLTEFEREHGRRRLDVLGAITVTAGVTAVVYGIVQFEQHGWGSADTLLPLFGGLALLGIFALVEWKVASEPLMPLRMVRARSVWATSLLTLLTGSSFYSIWYFVSLYQQDVLGYGVLEAGLGFLPHSVSIIIGSQLSSRLLARMDGRILITIGTLVSAAGFLWQAQATADSSYLFGVGIPGVLVAQGMGLVFTPVASIATSGVARSAAGLASGLLNTARQLGGALGLALLATIAADHASTAARGADPSPAQLVSGYQVAFTIAAVVLVVATAVTWLLPHTRKPGNAEAIAAVAAE